MFTPVFLYFIIWTHVSELSFGKSNFLNEVSRSILCFEHFLIKINTKLMLWQTWILQWTCSTDLRLSRRFLKIKQGTFHISKVVLNFSQSTFSFIEQHSFLQRGSHKNILSIKLAVDYSFLKTKDFTLHPESSGVNLQVSNVWGGNIPSKSTNFHTPWWCTKMVYQILTGI